MPSLRPRQRPVGPRDPHGRGGSDAEEGSKRRRKRGSAVQRLAERPCCLFLALVPLVILGLLAAQMILLRTTGINLFQTLATLTGFMLHVFGFGGKPMQQRVLDMQAAGTAGFLAAQAQPDLRGPRGAVANYTPQVRCRVACASCTTWLAARPVVCALGVRATCARATGRGGGGGGQVVAGGGGGSPARLVRKAF